MATIAVVGPGAVGGTFAALLASRDGSEHVVTVCARTPFDRLVVETPRGEVSLRPEVVVDPARARRVSWILIAVKAYDSDACASWLRAMIGEDTSVAILQNGVEHVARFERWVDRAKLLPVVVDCPAERRGPGLIRQRRDASCIVPASARGSAFQALFAATPIRVDTTEDFTTAAWRKLCVNSIGAISALVLEPASVARRYDVAELMRGILRECIMVGRAEGATLPDAIEDAILDGYRAGAPDAINSMHADRLARRPMEIDARNGAIVRLGARHGIATPLNTAMVALLKAVDVPRD